MVTNNISEYLKYANLQMAAEALLGAKSNSSSSITTAGLSLPLLELLPPGNNHASKLPSPQIANLPAEGWEILAHQPNTSTGFSATLFKNGKTGELVISFRSTEFVDDAVRDNQATNKLEIQTQGWALGQIADMEAWWEKLQANGVITRDAKVTVTGYSLGGHLATAFSLLHGTDRVSAVYTFNGAGVGDVHSNTSLDAVISEFQLRRTNTDGEQIRFSDARIQKLYRDIRAKFNAGTRPTDADFEIVDRTVGSPSEKGMIRQALTNIRTLWAEIDRVAALKEYSEGTKPVSVSALSTDGRTVQIEAVKLDYQLAVLMAAPSISPYRTNVALSGWDAISKRNVKGTIVGLPSYDIYGAQAPSGVANSQWHYGTDTPIYIEDQPLSRGNVVLSALVETVNYADAKLLVDYYTTNDFGDTHSLVLLVDSLAVQDLFARLDPLTTPAKLADFFSAATCTERETILYSQGKAEGYTLETILDGLFLTITGVDRRLRFLRTGPGESLDTGNTWHDMTAREALHAAIADLKNNDTFKALAGKVSLVTPATGADTARTDFGQFLALANLTPFALKTTDADGLAALKNANEALAQAWAADAQLTATQRAAGQGNYSDLWLADRAAMLSWLQRANNDNNPNLESSKIGKEAWAFNDLESGQNITVRPDGAFVAVTPHQVAFGSTADDALSGAELTDHLFGGDGNDTLTGNSGADILQSLWIVNENQISENVTRNQISTPHSSRHTDVYA